MKFAQSEFVGPDAASCYRATNSPRWSCPESCDAHEHDDSTEEVAQMNSVRVRDGQQDRVIDGPNLHDHDRAAEND